MTEPDSRRPVLVTGAAGFAGSHLLDLLRARRVPVVAWYRPGGRHRPALAAQPSPDQTLHEVRWKAVDLLERQTLFEALADLRPAAIYHCAGAANVASSWEHTGSTLKSNVLATHYLLTAAREAALTASILIPGSAMVYGPSTGVITEDHPVGPASPYGVSKLAQEMLGARAAVDENQRVVLTRSFNHVGPRQDPSFAASSFARQIARIEAGMVEPIIRVGNLEARRDLTDVRDTVRAYWMLVERGRPGRIYNVCSGQAYAVREVLDRLIALARVGISVRVDPALLRPQDNPIMVGSSKRLQEELGWVPEIPIERTLADLLEYWRAAVANERL